MQNPQKLNDQVGAIQFSLLVNYFLDGRFSYRIQGVHQLAGSGHM
jgi:hypothetical protein